MIYRITPMVWYNSRLQQHQTVYGIHPQPADISYRCESADTNDPLYIDNRHYNQILLDGSAVTWYHLPEWINSIMTAGYTLFPSATAEMPKPNQSFYIQK